MTFSSFTVLAVLLGIALYPFFANHLPNQRQNASAVIGVVLLGFIVFGSETIPEIAQGTPQYAALQVLAFLFFASGFLGRKLGEEGAERSALIPFGIGIFTAIANVLITSISAQLFLTVVQFACLLAITRTYNNLHKVTFTKAIYFSLLFCAVNGLIHINAAAPSMWQPDLSWTVISYNLLLCSCLFHMCFQDFSRTRTKKGWDEQTKVDQDLMKLAFRGRRVLKDFRHDLRQPLSTLGILASVGKAISKDPEVTARYQHIQTAQKALKNMLEEFFDQLASAIRYPVEENTAQLRKISIDEVLSPLIEEYRMLADVKELQIRYVPSNLTVLSNKELLSKIIRNGLDNAIKYTPKGGVVVGLRRRNGQVCIQIADTGSGVENNKVAAHNKGWGHGANIVRDLSEQILAKTECRNRYYNGQLAGSVFEVILPGEGEASHHWKLPNTGMQTIFEAQVMAMNHEHLLEIQRCLPIKGFDKVDFNLNGAYRAYLAALRKGMSPVYILYAGEAGQKDNAINRLKLLGSLLDYQPCCILIYNAIEETNPQIEFSREMIQIPMDPNRKENSLQIIAELFPCREKEPSSQSAVVQADISNKSAVKNTMLST
jgi:hypothetical protein